VRSPPWRPPDATTGIRAGKPRDSFLGKLDTEPQTELASEAALGTLAAMTGDSDDPKDTAAAAPNSDTPYSFAGALVRH